MTAIGVPLPHIATTPPEPLSRVGQPVAPDADVFRAGLYDARRELMRARAAALPLNVILGGFAPSLAGGELHLTPGVAQVRVPTTTWTATYPPAATKLYGPAESPSGVLPGVTDDGAYRAERRTPTVVQAGDGTTGPATGDSIVYLTFDGSAANRLRTAWGAVSGFLLDVFSVPVAWVRVASGAITMVRDLRPMPPWRPRIAQRIYAPVSQTVVSPLMLNTDSATLIPVDLGSFWLEAGQGVLLTLSVTLETALNLHAHEGVRVVFHVSRGDPADGFVDPHLWDTGTIMPAWATSFMNVGRNTFGLSHLFLPAQFNDPGAFTAQVAHFNGLVVTDIYAAWANTIRDGDFLGVRSAYLKAELVEVRKADDLFADLTTPPAPGLPSWGAQSFPPLSAPPT